MNKGKRGVGRKIGLNSGRLDIEAWAPAILSIPFILARFSSGEQIKRVLRAAPALQR